jgi:hypothetical protein
MSGAGFWLLLTGHRPPVTGHRPPTTSGSWVSVVPRATIPVGASVSFSAGGTIKCRLSTASINNATLGPQLQPVVINACPTAPAETAVPITLANRNANLAGNVSDTYTVTLTPGATLSGLKVPANGNLNQVVITLDDGKSNTATSHAITLLIKRDTPAGTIRLTATSGILAQIKHIIDIQVQVVRPGC